MQSFYKKCFLSDTTEKNQNANKYTIKCFPNPLLNTKGFVDYLTKTDTNSAYALNADQVS